MDSSDEPPSSEQSSPPSSESNNRGFVYRHALSAVLYAMAFNFVIGGLKLLVATTVTPSAALFSEGLHSMADALNSVTLLVGILQGKKQPDRTHPFGYGLETNLWALFACFVLLLSSIWAVYSGIERLSHPHEYEETFWAILILVVSLVLEVAAVYTAARAVLEEVEVEGNLLTTIPKSFSHIKHTTGPTTRFVFYEDTLAFLGALIALAALLGSDMAVSAGVLPLTMAHIPDAVASIIIGGLLLSLSINLFRYNRTVLTGSAAPVIVERKIRATVLGIYGVTAIHNLRTIDRGHAGMMVHMTVEVDPDTPVKDVDDLTERIKEKIQSRIRNVREVFIEVLADETDEDWTQRFEQLLEEGAEEGVLKPREVAILKNAFEFSESVVGDIMIPRTDVVSVELETPLSQVADLIISSGHSRLPVYKENVDRLVGMVHARDVFNCIREGKLDTALLKLTRDVEIYPENKAVSDLLEEFKRHRIHMAAVADEYGGFSGLVTIEDLLEEIVGEIWDEHEAEPLTLSVIEPNLLLVSGKYEVELLNERFDLNIPEHDFLTIGGFVFGQLGREPVQGDKVLFEELVFTVADTEGPRIISITIESPTPFKEDRMEEPLDGPVDSITSEVIQLKDHLQKSQKRPPSSTKEQ